MDTTTHLIVTGEAEGTPYRVEVRGAEGHPIKLLVTPLPHAYAPPDRHLPWVLVTVLESARLPYDGVEEPRPSFMAAAGRVDAHHVRGAAGWEPTGEEVEAVVGVLNRAARPHWGYGEDLQAARTPEEARAAYERWKGRVELAPLALEGRLREMEGR